MSDLKSRVAYLHGLSAGLDLGAENKEGKLLKCIIEVLDEFADQVVGLKEAQEQMEEYMDSLDEDLLDLEDEVYDENMKGYDDDNYMEVDCPKCGETVCFDAAVIEDKDIIEVTCPNCDEVVFINDDSHRAVLEPETAGMLNMAEDDVI